MGHQMENGIEDGRWGRRTQQKPAFRGLSLQEMETLDLLTLVLGQLQGRQVGEALPIMAVADPSGQP